MKRVAATIAAFIATLVVATSSFADVLWVPGSIKVGKFKKLMKQSGYDLSGKDSADGLVENLGTKLKVVTFAPATPEIMDAVLKCSVESRR